MVLPTPGGGLWDPHLGLLQPIPYVPNDLVVYIGHCTLYNTANLDMYLVMCTVVNSTVNSNKYLGIYTVP